jgi:hypothetical protein
VARKSKSGRAGRPRPAVRYPEQPERINPLDGIVLEDAGGGTRSVASADERIGHEGPWPSTLAPIYRDDAHGIWLYQGNCLSILDAIAAKYPDGCFDMIFADPPYFLSNGGITCHAVLTAPGFLDQATQAKTGEVC